MFRIICARGRSRVTALVTRVKTALRAALRPAGVVGGFIGDVTRSHSELFAENALLDSSSSLRLPDVLAPRMAQALTRGWNKEPPQAMLIVYPVGVSTRGSHASEARALAFLTRLSGNTYEWEDSCNADTGPSDDASCVGALRAAISRRTSSAGRTTPR